MPRAWIVRTVTVGAALCISACGGSSSPTAATGTSGGASSSVAATATTAASGSASGKFRTGHATIVTPTETIEVTLSSGSFIQSLGPNGSVSANWADSEQNDVGLLGDGKGGYKLSVVGRAAPNGITQNDCTAKVTKDQPSGVEGTYTCAGNISGTFEAH
ncbi:MAG: hypothetical protein QOG30_452 [Acidimicrobiaceae bacterium]|jgi:hypothetical protein